MAEVHVHESANREWKYKIEQTAMGARVTIHSMDIDEAVRDYGRIRQTLEDQGYPVAPENGITMRDKRKPLGPLPE